MKNPFHLLSLSKTLLCIHTHLYSNLSDFTCLVYHSIILLDI